jgi:hypothetical protein
LWYHGFHALGIPGAQMVKHLHAEHIAGFDQMYICQDNDQAGARFVAAIRDALRNMDWPGEAYVITCDGDVKDPNDLHKRDHGQFPGVFKAMMDHAKPLDTSSEPAKVGTPGLPEIDAGQKDVVELSAKAWDAIQGYNKTPTLFRRQRGLVRLDKELFLTEDLTPERLQHALGRAAIWYRIDKKSEEQISALVPSFIVKDMLADPTPPVPRLDRITRVPVFAPDGTLQDKPGYHEAGKVYYQPKDGVSIPEVPPAPSDGH